jgi:hypothetical protein
MPSVYDWYNKFSEGHKEVSNPRHARIQSTAVYDMNICCVTDLSLGKTKIKMCDIASNSGISVGSIETITYLHLLFKLCAQWVTKMLTFDQKVHCVAAVR